jgi:hypothetical protein
VGGINLGVLFRYFPEEEEESRKTSGQNFQINNRTQYLSNLKLINQS